MNLKQPNLLRYFLFSFYIKNSDFSQLFYDGHQQIGQNLAQAVQAEPACAPSDRLFNIVLAGLEHEPDRKERPKNFTIGNNQIGSGLGKTFSF